MAVCSLQRIEITDEDQVYRDGADQDLVLLDFGDQLDAEVSHTPSSQSQDSLAIDSAAAVVRGRRNRSQKLSWSRTKTHLTPEAARRYLQTHIANIPSWTVGARITYESDPENTPQDGFQTYRARVEAYPGLPVTGLDTTVNYTLVWQFDTSAGGGAPPPADDYQLLTNAGDKIFSPRSPQILIFH